MKRPLDAPADWQPDWTYLGRTMNTENYVCGRLLVAWPDQGAIDTKESALANVASQTAYFDELGQPGVIAIYFDRLAHQDRDARGVYASMGTPATVSGVALIGGTLLSRALGSFFLGISRSKHPLRMFPSYTDAKPWIDEWNAARP